MIARALTLPALCIALLLAGCQPSESPEYKEALADFDKHTVKLVERTFEIHAMVAAKEFDRAEIATAGLKDLAKEGDLAIERIVNLRPRKPDEKLYAQAMKEREEIDKVLKDLDFRRRQKQDDLETLKTLTLEAERKKYDAIERSMIHHP